ncbi:olfactory receptor 52E4 [Acipenser ruthenus]|uniref:olfactory receptor 52E4 n=1 Tax=Acipenser ruthenus TaxID=7906 RepID=UPI0027412269|nr:olfactory receptor 52E4 [Acipenser ruthenus]
MRSVDSTLTQRTHRLSELLLPGSGRSLGLDTGNAMDNSSYDTAFIFTAYGKLDSFRPLYFIVVLLVYLITIFVNVFLMTVIYMETSLHKPMYILVLHLSLNGLFGSSAFYPKVMANLLSDVQESSRFGCLVQAFCISSYGACAYAVLAVMAYDRYISICNPLRYYSILTPSKVNILLSVAYLLPILLLSIHILLIGRLPLCGFSIHKLLCDNWTIARLSCVDTKVINIFGLFLTTALLIFPFLLVVYSYARILSVSLNASKEAQGKALSTCTPHLITFINFSIASLFSIMYNRFGNSLPISLHIMMLILFVVIPPFLNPIIYGIRTREIRKCIIKILRKRQSNVQTGVLTAIDTQMSTVVAPRI